LQLWKSHDINSSIFSPWKLVNSLDRNWLHEYILPIEMLAYQCCAERFTAMMKAFALMAEPPPLASVTATYLSKNCLGFVSPSYYGKITALKRGGHGTRLVMIPSVSAISYSKPSSRSSSM
jgi:hypothetical protein